MRLLLAPNRGPGAGQVLRPRVGLARKTLERERLSLPLDEKSERPRLWGGPAGKWADLLASE